MDNRKPLGDLKVKAAIKALALLLPLLGLVGCATQRFNGGRPATTRENVGQILNQPFADLNVSQSNIPPLLLRAELAPYALPNEPGCPGLSREISSLTALLGPDLAPSSKNDNTKSGAQISGGDAWSAARNAVNGLIPFHSVVRWISGADRYDKEVERAILAGFVRRAYLEGSRDQQGCSMTAER